MTTPTPDTLRAAASRAITAQARFRAANDATVKIDDFQAFFSLSEAYSDAMSHLATTLDSEPAALSLHSTTSGRPVVFTPSTKQQNTWQITRFGTDGQPWGDSTYQTRLSGLKDFLREADLDQLHNQDGPLQSGPPADRAEDGSAPESAVADMERMSA